MLKVSIIVLALVVAVPWVNAQMNKKPAAIHKISIPSSEAFICEEISDLKRQANALRLQLKLEDKQEDLSVQIEKLRTELQLKCDHEILSKLTVGVKP